MKQILTRNVIDCEYRDPEDEMMACLRRDTHRFTATAMTDRQIQGGNVIRVSVYTCDKHAEHGEEIVRQQVPLWTGQDTTTVVTNITEAVRDPEAEDGWREVEPCK